MAVFFGLTIVASGIFTAMAVWPVDRTVTVWKKLLSSGLRCLGLVFCSIVAGIMDELAIPLGYCMMMTAVTVMPFLVADQFLSRDVVVIRWIKRLTFPVCLLALIALSM